MTNYEKIKLLLDMNVYEGVKVDSPNIFPNGTNTFRDIDEKTIHEIKQIKDSITSITPIPRVPKLLPVGTKVIVFEEWLDKLQEWTSILNKDTNYKILKICDIDYRYYIWYNEWHWERVPARAVYPVWEE